MLAPFFSSISMTSELGVFEADNKGVTCFCEKQIKSGNEDKHKTQRHTIFTAFTLAPASSRRTKRGEKAFSHLLAISVVNKGVFCTYAAKEKA
jgi:hypothetical protein